MGTYIVKMERDGVSAYMEWSTISDAPRTRLMPIGEFEQHCLEEYGRRFTEEKLPDRMKRVESWGTSSRIHQNAEDVMTGNRAGENESELTPDEIWDEYRRPPLEQVSSVQAVQIAKRMREKSRMTKSPTPNHSSGSTFVLALVFLLILAVIGWGVFKASRCQESVVSAGQKCAPGARAHAQGDGVFICTCPSVRQEP